LLDPSEISGAPPRVGSSQAEMDEFDRELEKMINEATHAPHTRVTGQINDIRIPMNIHKQSSEYIFQKFKTPE